LHSALSAIYLIFQVFYNVSRETISKISIYNDTDLLLENC